MHEDAAQALALHRVVKLRVKRVYINWQAALTPHVVPHVLKARRDVVRRQAQLVGQRGGKSCSVLRGVVARFALVGKQGRVLPDGLAVFAPEDAERPARQLFTRVPLALAKMQKAALAIFSPQLLHQLGGVAAFGRAESVNVPFSAVGVIRRDEGRLAAHCQAHIASGQITVNCLAQGQHLGPLVVGVRFGHARGFVNALHTHVVGKLDF